MPLTPPEPGFQAGPRHSPIKPGVPYGNRGWLRLRKQTQRVGFLWLGSPGGGAGRGAPGDTDLLLFSQAKQGSQMGRMADRWAGPPVGGAGERRPPPAANWLPGNVPPPPTQRLMPQLGWQLQVNPAP